MFWQQTDGHSPDTVDTTHPWLLHNKMIMFVDLLCVLPRLVLPPRASPSTSTLPTSLETPAPCFLCPASM